MTGSPERVTGDSRVGSILADNLPVVPDGEPVEDIDVGCILQDRDVPVGEGELADAGVVAAELAMPRAVQVVGPLTQVEFREAGDPVVVAGEVAVGDGSVAPRGAALAVLAPG